MICDLRYVYTLYYTYRYIYIYVNVNHCLWSWLSGVLKVLFGHGCYANWIFIQSRIQSRSRGLYY